MGKSEQVRELVVEYEVLKIFRFCKGIWPEHELWSSSLVVWWTGGLRVEIGQDSEVRKRTQRKGVIVGIFFSE